MHLAKNLSKMGIEAKCAHTSTSAKHGFNKDSSYFRWVLRYESVGSLGIIIRAYHKILCISETKVPHPRRLQNLRRAPSNHLRLLPSYENAT